MKVAVFIEGKEIEHQYAPVPALQDFPDGTTAEKHKTRAEHIDYFLELPSVESVILLLKEYQSVTLSIGESCYPELPTLTLKPRLYDERKAMV